MSKIKIFFSDGSVEVFDKDALFDLYEKRFTDWEPKSSYFSVKNSTVLLKSSNKSMAIDFMESLADIEFFTHNESGTVYKVSSIVKIVDF